MGNGIDVCGINEFPTVTIGGTVEPIAPITSKFRNEGLGPAVSPKALELSTSFVGSTLPEFHGICTDPIKGATRRNAGIRFDSTA